MKKSFPAILTLTAGAATALITYFRGYSLKVMSIALLATLVCFYMIGGIIQMIIDSFEKKNKEADKTPETGEVIEKEPANTDNQQNRESAE